MLKKRIHSQLLKNVMPFWLESDLINRKFGGYITSVYHEGRSYNDDKSVWFQGRCLWTFSTLCEKYGVCPEWENAAKFGKEFPGKRCTDANGRMFFTAPL